MGQRLNEYLEVNDRGNYRCLKCGQEFGPVLENWKEKAVCQETDATAGGSRLPKILLSGLRHADGYGSKPETGISPEEFYPPEMTGPEEGLTAKKIDQD